MKLSISSAINIIVVFFKKMAPGGPAVLLTFAYLFFDYHIKAAIAISPDVLARPLIFMWLLLIPVFFFVHKITKSTSWTGLYLYFFVLVFYTSEFYFNLVIALTIIFVVAWVAIYYILRRKLATIKHIIVITTLLPVFLFFMTFIRVFSIYTQPDWYTYITALPNTTYIIKPLSPLPEAIPDIYYIVLDGYGRADTLREYYGYDNSSFINYLKDKGFTIPTSSYSNYAKTVASVSSTLNMNYLPNFIKGVDDSLFWWQVKPYIRENIVQASLEEMGYQSITIATDWDITNNPNADLYFKPRPLHLTEYEGKLIEQSRLNNIIGPLLSRVAFYPTNNSHRELINFSFNALIHTATLPGPKFVFAHIVAPHPPFVFDKMGNPISPEYGFTFNDADNFPGTREEYRTEYVGQLEHVNRLLKETIDAILAQSETPPIIILQADHGPGMLTDFSSSKNTCLKERFSIFTAYYLPSVSSDVVPNDISSVNTFRIIFNEYFSTKLPLLENASYYFKDTVYVFRTEDVTAQLNDPNYNNSCVSNP